MRRPVMLGGNPYIGDIYRKSAKTLFDESGGNSGNLAFQFAIASHLAAQIRLYPHPSIASMRHRLKGALPMLTGFYLGAFSNRGP